MHRNPDTRASSPSGTEAENTSLQIDSTPENPQDFVIDRVDLLESKTYRGSIFEWKLRRAAKRLFLSHDRRNDHSKKKVLVSPNSIKSRGKIGCCLDFFSGNVKDESMFRANESPCVFSNERTVALQI